MTRYDRSSATVKARKAEQRERGCPTPSKNFFETEKEARKYLDSVVTKLLNGYVNIPVRAYGDCPCGKWHTTSRDRKDTTL